MPVLEREPKKTLKDRVQCPQCSKWISEHCFRYSHKCKARAPEEPPAPVEPKRAVRIRAPEKEKKPEPAEKKSMKRPPVSQEPSPILNFGPPQMSAQEQWLQQRNAVMSARTASMMAPYQAMFASMR